MSEITQTITVVRHSEDMYEVHLNDTATHVIHRDLETLLWYCVNTQGNRTDHAWGEAALLKALSEVIWQVEL